MLRSSASRGPQLASLTLAALAGLCTAPLAVAGDTLRVPADYSNLQQAVDAAHSGDTILVGPGKYLGTGNRDIDLGTKELTIQSEAGAGQCEIDCEGNPVVPFRGFLIDGGQTSATVIDGFTIIGGATLPGAVADEFNGGAIRILGASPTIKNCVFKNNAAGCWGGAVYSAHGGSPLIENCLFENNLSLDGGGGLFSWNGSTPTVRNSVFKGNDGSTSGGALLHGGPDRINIENCTFVENVSFWGSALSVSGANITSSIVWNNAGRNQVSASFQETAIAYSNIEGGVEQPEWDAGGNIDAFPGFQADGFHLTGGSPCINRGDPAALVGNLKDIDGQPRRMLFRVDIGADEVFMRPKLAR